MKSLTTKIREMSDTAIEQLLLSKDANQTPLTVIDDVPIDFEDIHILYRVAKQTKYEATAEQGVRPLFFVYFSVHVSLSLSLHLCLVCCSSRLYG